MLKKNHTNLTSLSNIPSPKFLVQRADRLGDLVLALPVIEELKRLYPHSKISLLCSSRNCQLIQTHPLIDNHIVFDLHKSPSSKKKKKLIKSIKESSFSLYICLWHDPFFISLGYKANIPFRFGPYINILSNYYFTHPTKMNWNNSLIHESIFNISCLTPFKQDCFPVFKLYPSLSSETSIQGHLKPSNSKQSIVFFCNSGKENTHVSEDLLIDVISYLSKSNNYLIYLTYGDLSKNTKLQALSLPNIVNINELLNLDALTQLINSSNLYVGPDTGPSHIAWVLNKKTILIYKTAENRPTRWGPLCDQFRIINFNYISESISKHYREFKSIVLSVNTLSKENSVLTYDEKILIHKKHSLRFIWLCDDLDTFYLSKKTISALLKENWVIFVHIKRKNPIKNLYLLFKRMKQRKINGFYSSGNHILIKIINFIVYTQTMPKLVVRKIKLGQ